MLNRKRSAQLFGTFDDLFDSVKNALTVAPSVASRLDDRAKYHAMARRVVAADYLADYFPGEEAH